MNIDVLKIQFNSSEINPNRINNLRFIASQKSFFEKSTNEMECVLICGTLLNISELSTELIIKQGILPLVVDKLDSASQSLVTPIYHLLCNCSVSNDGTLFTSFDQKIDIVVRNIKKIPHTLEGMEICCNLLTKICKFINESHSEIVTFLVSEIIPGFLSSDFDSMKINTIWALCYLMENKNCFTDSILKVEIHKKIKPCLMSFNPNIKFAALRFMNLLGCQSAHAMDEILKLEIIYCLIYINHETDDIKMKNECLFFFGNAMLDSAFQRSIILENWNFLKLEKHFELENKEAKETALIFVFSMIEKCDEEFLSKIITSELFQHLNICLLSNDTDVQKLVVKGLICLLERNKKLVKEINQLKDVEFLLKSNDQEVVTLAKYLLNAYLL